MPIGDGDGDGGGDNAVRSGARGEGRSMQTLKQVRYTQQYSLANHNEHLPTSIAIGTGDITGAADGRRGEGETKYKRCIRHI